MQTNKSRRDPDFPVHPDSRNEMIDAVAPGDVPVIKNGKGEKFILHRDGTATVVGIFGEDLGRHTLHIAQPNSQSIQLIKEGRKSVVYHGHIGLLGGTFHLNISSREYRSYFKVEVEANDTILSVKQKIEQLHGIPVKKQVLTCPGKTLMDWKTLAEYNISERYILELRTKCVGGGVKATNFKEKEDLTAVDATLDDIINGRCHGDGMTVEGICKDDCCKLNGNKVRVMFNYSETEKKDKDYIVNKHGLLWFSFGKIKKEAKCPRCKKRLKEVETISFYNCRYKVFGELDDDDSEVKIPAQNYQDNEAAWWAKFAKTENGKISKFKGGGDASSNYASLWIAVYKC